MLKLFQNIYYIIFLGKKTFLGNVSTTQVIVEGKVDGLSPNEIITLSSTQKIPDNFTFADLEITESFRVIH